MSFEEAVDYLEEAQTDNLNIQTYRNQNPYDALVK
jgi:hypothetical protein